MLCPLDLRDRAAREPGGAQKAVLDGAHRATRWAIIEHCGNERVVDEQISAGEPLHKGVGVLEGWQLPRRAVQPESPTHRRRQLNGVIDQLVDGQVGHERAELEGDAEELRTSDGLSEAGLGFRAAHRDMGCAIEAPEHQLPLARRPRDKCVVVLALRAPDPLHQWRV